MTAAFVTNPDRLAAIIENVGYLALHLVLYSGITSDDQFVQTQRAYVVYPPESKRPPSYEELAELRSKNKKQ